MKLQQRSRRRARIVRRAAIAVAGVVGLLFAAGGVYLATLQSVGDAQARARRIMLSHGEPVASLPTPSRLVASVVSVEDEQRPRRQHDRPAARPAAVRPW